MPSRLPLVLIAVAILSSSASAQLVLHEVLHDPVGADDGAELIEIHNPTGAAVDLTRWAIWVRNREDFSRHMYAFEPGRSLAAGAYVLVHWRASGSSDADDVYTESEGEWEFGGNEEMHDGGFAIALYEDDDGNWVGPDWDDETLIRDFASVGAQDIDSVGVAAGIWTEYDFVLLRGEGIAVLYDGTGDASPDFFGDVRGLIRGDNGVPTTPVYTYGTGCSGGDTWTEHIPDTDQIPADSSTRFQLSLINAYGTVQTDLAFMVAGYGTDQVPFGPDCTLWTTFDFLIGPFIIQGLGEGKGTVLLDGRNPNPGSGLEINLTFFSQDRSYFKNFTISNAIHLKF